MIYLQYFWPPDRPDAYVRLAFRKIMPRYYDLNVSTLLKHFWFNDWLAGGGRPHELYGFLVKDIPRLIEQDCAQYSHGDSDSGQVVDTARRYQLMYRYKYLAHSLRPFGYDFHFHPHFAARLVGLTVTYIGPTVQRPCSLYAADF